MDIVRFVLLVVGLVYLVTESFILRSFRQQAADLHHAVEYLVYCPACVGFWVGLCFSGAWPFAGPLQSVESAIAACAIGACWGAFAADATVWQSERFHSSDDELAEEEGNHERRHAEDDE